MMKNNIKILVVALLVAFLITGCAPAGSQKDIENMKQEIKDLQDEVAELKEIVAGSAILSNLVDVSGAKTVDEAKKIDEDAIIKQFKTTEHVYKFESSYGSYNYLVLGIENGSEYNLKIDVEVIFKDENGGIIGTKDTWKYGCEAGQTVGMLFSCDDNFASYEYIYSVEEYTSDECILSSLSYETSITDNKVIIAITNNNEEIDADSVSYIMVYMKDDEPVSIANGMCYDVKAGKTSYEEDKYYTEFDTVKVYLHGRVKD